MKGKLTALREGRIPSDEEFASILEENVVTSANQSSVPPDEMPEDNVGEGNEDDHVDGEDVDEDKLSDVDMEDLLKDFIRYDDKKQFLSTSFFSQN
jgi:hypothetical protein